MQRQRIHELTYDELEVLDFLAQTKQISMETHAQYEARLMEINRQYYRGLLTEQELEYRLGEVTETIHKDFTPTGQIMYTAHKLEIGEKLYVHLFIARYEVLDYVSRTFAHDFDVIEKVEGGELRNGLWHSHWVFELTNKES